MLTLNCFGLHDNQTLISDLQLAVDLDYHSLQATLKEVRAIGVLESKLNLKWAELKVVAHQIINHLQGSLMEEQAQEDTLANQALLSIPLAKMTPEMRCWVSKLNKPSEVMLVLKPSHYMGQDYYLTFASDALVVLRNTDLIRTYTLCDNQAVVTVGIPKHRLDHYRKQLALKGITLITYENHC